MASSLKKTKVKSPFAKLYYALEETYYFMKKSHSKFSKNEPENIP